MAAMDFLFEPSGEDGTPATFGPNDWAEATGMTSPTTMNVSDGRSQVHMFGYVDWVKMKACVQWLVGYGWVDESKQLRREVPGFNPYWEMLYCDSVTDIIGIGPDGREEPLYMNSLKKAKWDRVKIGASFSTTPWKVRSDAAMSTDSMGRKKEWERFTTFLPEPYTEYIQVDTGSYKYQASSPLQPWNDKPVGFSNLRVKEQKQRLEVIWYAPWDFVFDENDFSPKFAAMDGACSKRDWHGRPGNTLLCDGVRVEKTNYPVAADLFQFDMYAAKITFMLKYFDPPRGFTGGKRGWQTMPGPDLLYYPARSSVDGVSPPYQEFDFADAFTHWSVAAT